MPDIAVCRDDAPMPEALRRAVIAIGNFDGVHLGHQALIRAAVDQARVKDRPAGILTFEPHPRAFFDPGRLYFRLTPEPVKLKICSKLGLDAVFIRAFDGAMAATTAEDFVEHLVLRELAASALVIGHDFHFGRGRGGTPAVLADLAARLGLEVSIVDAVELNGVVVSSSRIRAALEAGDVGAANALLGYRWFLTGTVEHGAKRGRTLGYPTANLRLDEGCGLAYGIYAVRMAIASGAIKGGVASFGRRPTFDGGAPLLETYLFDFSGDLYGAPVEVEFIDWIRAEERFASAEDLVARMRQDEQDARKLLERASMRDERSFIG